MGVTAEDKFDPMDPIWATDLSNFPPNKESTWTYQKEEDGWMHAHNAIRMELKAFKTAMKAVLAREELVDWEVSAIKKWWHSHKAHITSHHETEDKLMNKFLRTRFKYPEKLETDHDGIVEIVDELDSLIQGLKAGTLDKVKAICLLWDKYDSVMRPHLEEEEHIGLTLSRVYFAKKEMDVKVQQILKEASPEDLGCFIYCMGQDHFRNTFIIPFFVWWIDLRYKYNLYKNEIAVLIESLTSGTPPAKPSSFWDFLPWY